MYKLHQANTHFLVCKIESLGLLDYQIYYPDYHLVRCSLSGFFGKLLRRFCCQTWEWKGQGHPEKNLAKNLQPEITPNQQNKEEKSPIVLAENNLGNSAKKEQEVLWLFIAKRLGKSSRLRENERVWVFDRLRLKTV